MNRIRLRLLVGLAFVVICAGLRAQDSGVLGYWQEPGGSIIHVDHCGSNLCARLVAISASAPSRVDGNNPNESLRKRSLCGLRIGDGFQASGPSKAEGGTLYDPKSGKTYHGRMESHGDKLDLRGYFAFAIFGRTETWARTSEVKTCTGND